MDIPHYLRHTPQMYYGPVLFETMVVETNRCHRFLSRFIAMLWRNEVFSWLCRIDLYGVQALKLRLF